MDFAKIFSKILEIKNSVAIIINRKNKIIEQFFDEDKIIKENITFDDFLLAVPKMRNIEEKEIVKFKAIFDYLDTDNKKFDFTLSIEQREPKKSVEYTFYGYLLDDNTLMIIIGENDYWGSAIYDDLTKLYNEATFNKKIREEITAYNPFVMMVINIDNFGQFNEEYGTIFGDLILIEVAASIRKYLGSNGYACRLYADKFVLLTFLDYNYDQIHRVCTDMRQAIADVSKHNIKQTKISATIGCVHFPNDAQTLDDLINKANRALNRGKKTKGGDCFIMYTPKCEPEEYNYVYKPTGKDFSETATNGAKIIAGVFEIFNHQGTSLKTNILDSLSLLGNFYQLDRVCLLARVPDELRATEFSITYEWVNPKKPYLAGLIDNYKYGGEAYELAWEKTFDQTGLLKINRIQSCKHLGLVYDQLVEQKVTAMLLFELKFAGKILGVLRFDVCGKNRVWNTNAISALMVMSKFFSIKLFNDHEQKFLEKTLYYDSLTGLYNVTKFKDEIFSFISDSLTYPNYTMISLKIHNFDSIHNLRGIDYADRLIINLGNALKDIKEKNIFACRVAIDNFLLFIPYQDQTKVSALYELISSKVKQISNNDEIIIDAGIYEHNGVDTLNNSIDKANLTSKSKQPGLHFFTNETYEEFKRISDIEMHMNTALDNNEFLLYLQPKVNIETGEIIGAEALSRWNYKHQSILYPDSFIPIFEQTGFINKFDYKVFENVCRFQRECIDDGLVPLKISINVSRYQKNFDEYIKRIDEIRELYKVDARLIEIEITESMYIENVDVIAKFIDDLHKHNYSISMDDFGSGYSNLANLANLDFDTIKLDKNFCGDQNNPKEGIILSTIMNLVKNLKMDVLCEGVETSETANFLRSIGCKVVQGYLFDRPINCAEFKKKYLSKKGILKFNVDTHDIDTNTIS